MAANLALLQGLGRLSRQAGSPGPLGAGQLQQAGVVQLEPTHQLLGRLAEQILLLAQLQLQLQMAPGLQGDRLQLETANQKKQGGRR